MEMRLVATELTGRFGNNAIGDVFFGSGCLDGLARQLDRDTVHHPMIVTGPTLSREEEMVSRLEACLGARPVNLFTQTVPHNPRETVLMLADYMRDTGSDALVSFGGSSPNEAAKGAVWALAENITRPEQFDEYAIRFDDPDTKIVPPLRGEALPIYAVPTTLSAGEFTNIVGITDSSRRHKFLYQDRKIAARAVFLDPAMTLRTPEWLWLSTGVKAIDHCVEALLSTRSQPMTDALAIQALKMLFKGLPACRAGNTDLDARLACQIAAWMSVSGLANVSLGLSHGIGHQLGAVSAVPHGYTSCVILPHVIAFNLTVTMERQAWIAAQLDLQIDGNVLDLESATRLLIQDQLGLPSRLRDIGVLKEDLDQIASLAIHDPLVATNPRRIGAVGEISHILHRAW